MQFQMIYNFKQIMFLWSSMVIPYIARLLSKRKYSKTFICPENKIFVCIIFI